MSRALKSAVMGLVVTLVLLALMGYLGMLFWAIAGILGVSLVVGVIIYDEIGETKKECSSVLN